MSQYPTTITAQPGTPFIEVERDFDATPAQVFRAWTAPELVAQWLGPRGYTMDIREYDARPGGRYHYIHRDTDGAEFGFRGVFHTVDQNELIVQTFEYDGSPGVVSLDTATYREVDGRTRVSTRTVFPSVESRDAAIASGMEGGIRDSMDRLTEVLEQDRPAAPRGTGRVVVDITMSLDGYVTARDAGPDNGLGIGGLPLHDWVLAARTERDTQLLDETIERTGAVIMGRRTFDVVDGPKGWSDDMGYGADREPNQPPPVIVVTHSAPEKVRLGDRFVFVTDGLDRALDRARAAAGDKDVVIMGGGDIADQFLRAGLVDELTIHLSPIVLGSGTPLFSAKTDVALRLELLRTESTAGAQHLTYRVLNEATS